MGLLTNPQAKRGRGRESWVWARISSDKQVRGAKSIKSFRKIQSKYINQITSHSQDNQQFTSQTVHQSAAPQLPLPNCLFPTASLSLIWVGFYAPPKRQSMTEILGSS